MTPSQALVAALRVKAGAPFRHLVATSPWHGVDMSGQRHELELGFDDPAAATRLLDGLTDYDFDVGGSFVADIIAHRVPANGTFDLFVEALTLDAT